jgi:hypothetical protein
MPLSTNETTDPPATDPQETPPQGSPDLDSKPTSLFAGIGNCVWDELVGIWDLIKFLYELKEDFDIASDGEDNWVSSMMYDSIQTGIIFYNLAQGSRQVESYDQQQQLALQRLYAKQQLIKNELEKIMDAGIDFTAALDVHILETEKQYYIPYVPRQALKGLAEGLQLLYTDAEWATRAARGKAAAEQFVETLKKEAEARPWYVAGYAICIIVTMIVPITKVTKAIKALKPVLRILDGITDSAGLMRMMRGRGIDLPNWLGGRRGNNPDGPDIQRDRIDEPAADTDGPRNNPADDNTPDADTDNNSERVEDPEDPETPDTDSETTRIEQNRRNQSKGALAEAAARDRLEAEGYEVFELKNESGHGPDIIAVKPGNPPQVQVVEVKANSSTLSTPQELGGTGYLRDVYRRIDSLPEGGTWNVDEFNDFLADNGIPNRDALLNGDFEIWRYKGVEADAPSSVGAPQTTPWTPGKTGTAFELDANGQPTTVLGDRRVWTQQE